MTTPQTEEDFKRVMNFTTNLVKNGDFKQVLKIIKSQLNVKDPNTVIALSMLAGLMRDKGKTEEAHDLFKSVYDTMKQSIGEDHKETLSMLHNVALTSSLESETNKLLVDLVAISSTKGYDDLLVTFSKSLEEFRSKLSISKKRLYDKIDAGTKIEKSQVKKSTTKKQHLTNEELDALVKEFGLDDNTKSKKNKNKTKNPL